MMVFVFVFGLRNWVISSFYKDEEDCVCVCFCSIFNMLQLDLACVCILNAMKDAQGIIL